MKAEFSTQAISLGNVGLNPPLHTISNTHPMSLRRGRCGKPINRSRIGFNTILEFGLNLTQSYKIGLQGEGCPSFYKHHTGHISWQCETKFTPSHPTK